MKINIPEELDAHGIVYEPNDENSVKIHCLYHDDNNPSCHVYLDSQRFKCYSCGKSGTFIQLIAKRTNAEAADVFDEFGIKYTNSQEKFIYPRSVDEWHAQIGDAPHLVKELHARGITDALIKQYKLGFNPNMNRITIPITNAAGMYVNVKNYLPGAKKNKFLGIRGYGKEPRLYPVKQLIYDELVICGGELKAIVAANELNEHNIGVVASVNGEGSWSKQLTPFFRDKYVHIIMDIDDAGQMGAEIVAREILSVAERVTIITLPLDAEKYPTGDINDYVATEKGSLYELIKEAEEWKPKELQNERYDETELPEEVGFNESLAKSNTTRKIKFNAVVTSMGQSPYKIPKKLEVLCNRDAEKCCPACPIYLDYRKDNQIVHIGAEEPVILEIVGQRSIFQENTLRKDIGIPEKCKKHKFSVREYYNVEDVVISPELEITSRSTDRPALAAYCVGEDVEMNETYSVEGRVFPHPANQKAVMLISNFKTTQDVLSTYQIHDTERLKLFQPKEWTKEAISTKLNELYEDMEANVTHIFQRREMHLGMDLVYHSPLTIRFDNDNKKGWTEVLIVGDSSQGKSETLERLIEHYGLGEKIDCNSASTAGLKGGLAKGSNDQWFITWGVIPTHDKRLIALEEVKNAPIEVIKSIREMRSSGIAELVKIEKRRAKARTRIIATSNPRSDNKPVSMYNYGLDTIKELIGALEDIRRFDFCLVLDREEVDTNKLQRLRPIVEHKYTSELCRELVLWCWTREKVEFEDENHLVDTAVTLFDKYVDDIPIFDRGSGRIKLAKLAAALAGRTFSTRTGEDIYVRKCHVDYVSEFIQKVYDKDTFGYLDYSRSTIEKNTLVDAEKVLRRLKEVPYPVDFLKHLLEQEEIDFYFVQNFTAGTVDSTKDLILFLLIKRALVLRKEQGRAVYAKTSGFTKLIKHSLANGFVESSKIPDYLKDTDNQFG